MHVPTMPQKVHLRTSIFPACQALLTGCSTLMGVVLMILWRPDRPRYVPFYSDASHKDPERVLLACGENVACFFMPLVALFEYLQQTRVLAETAALRPNPPPSLRWLAHPRLTTRHFILLNFAATSANTVAFFITANLPSKRPFTPYHQLAASGLIFFYAVQSVCKAILASTFNNYTSGLQGNRSQLEMWWERHHMKLRMTLVYVLWLSLVGTWMTFAGRKVVVLFDMEHPSAKRAFLAMCMAIVVYFATTACVTLMFVIAIDMRHDCLTVTSRSSGEEKGAVQAFEKNGLSTATF